MTTAANKPTPFNPWTKNPHDYAGHSFQMPDGNKIRLDHSARGFSLIATFPQGEKLIATDISNQEACTILNDVLQL